jgi:Fe2+ transport system protein FeoA
MSAGTLAELNVGGRARIAGFALEPDLQQRLMEMGLTKGAECQLIRFAPLGDPGGGEGARLSPVVEKIWKRREFSSSLCNLSSSGHE